MIEEKINLLKEGLTTAYIDGSAATMPAYKPMFLSNNPGEGKKVLAEIEEELAKCDKFQISVAFITNNGIEPLMQTFKELEEKNIPGEILTTNYLDFSEPMALKRLADRKNITLKMYDVNMARDGFHTKGYIFRRDELYRIIIGSSNITSTALTTNKEWNTKIISTEQGEIAGEIVREFAEFWNSEYAIPYDEFIDSYKEEYEIIKKQRKIAESGNVTSLIKYTLKPNSMQLGFIANLRKIVEKSESRALLISATGTGKTYASAFAIRELGYKKVLFLVHRAALARQAMASFKNVFDDSKSMGLVGDGKAEYDADFIFAMVETLHKEDNLRKFSPDEFDCIVLDEYDIIGLSREAA